MLDVAELVMRAALHRDESRGPHLRFVSPDAPEPIPEDDSRWQRHIVIQYDGKRAKLRAEQPVRPLWAQQEYPR
jgi:succinate dehydrogenase / fumarate reductase flavoprotein subunit